MLRCGLLLSQANEHKQAHVNEGKLNILESVQQKLFLIYFALLCVCVRHASTKFAPFRVVYSYRPMNDTGIISRTEPALHCALYHLVKVRFFWLLKVQCY